jgi:asparagine synthase (glutamine-hydrolysing)
MSMARYLARDLGERAETMFLDVKSLLPAHIMTADRNAVRVRRYWDIEPRRAIRYKRQEEYSEHFGEVLRRSAKRRVRTQAGSVAVEMSGGLDSCSVAALASDLYSKGDARAQPFALSYVFDQLLECDERQFSSQMSRDGSLDIDYVKLENHWLLGDREAYRPHLETPFMAWEAGQAQLAAKARAFGARVVLTGQSGDGVASGSLDLLADQVRAGRVLVAAKSLFRESRLRGKSAALMAYQRILRPLVPEWVNWLPGVLNGWRTGSGVPRWMAPSLAKRLKASARESDDVAYVRFTEAAKRQQYESAVRNNGAGWWGYLYDRSMGSHGIEARHPFLDRNLVEFVLALPAEVLYEEGRSKPLLRQSMSGLLPEEVRLRSSKTSFSRFTAFSLREKEGDYLMELLEAPLLAEMGFVDGPRVRDFCREYVVGERGSDVEMWMLVTAERWLLAHWQ